MRVVGLWVGSLLMYWMVQELMGDSMMVGSLFCVYLCVGAHVCLCAFGVCVFENINAHTTQH